MSTRRAVSASLATEFVLIDEGRRRLGALMGTRTSAKPFLVAVALFAAATVGCATTAALADEGGVSFWFPGLYGSLAAAPQVPGWAIGYRQPI